MGLFKCQVGLYHSWNRLFSASSWDLWIRVLGIVFASYVRAYVHFPAHTVTIYPGFVGQVPVLEKLLALRRTCHQLAAEENNNNENVAVISCVDALFAKLGHLVSHIGSYQRDEACPSLPSDPLPQNSFTIGGHREETSLRAALQLPRTPICLSLV